MLDYKPFFEDLPKALPMRHKAAMVKLRTELGLLSPGNAVEKYEAYLALSGMVVFF